MQILSNTLVKCAPPHCEWMDPSSSFTRCTFAGPASGRVSAVAFAAAFSGILEGGIATFVVLRSCASTLCAACFSP